MFQRLVLPFDTIVSVDSHMELYRTECPDPPLLTNNVALTYAVSIRLLSTFKTFKSSKSKSNQIKSNQIKLLAMVPLIRSTGAQVRPTATMQIQFL